MARRCGGVLPERDEPALQVLNTALHPLGLVLHSQAIASTTNEIGALPHLLYSPVLWVQTYLAQASQERGAVAILAINPVQALLKNGFLPLIDG